jgi:hypothetical protein
MRLAMVSASRPPRGDALGKLAGIIRAQPRCPRPRFRDHDGHAVAGVELHDVTQQKPKVIVPDVVFRNIFAVSMGHEAAKLAHVVERSEPVGRFNAALGLTPSVTAGDLGVPCGSV